MDAAKDVCFEKFISTSELSQKLEAFNREFRNYPFRSPAVGKLYMGVSLNGGFSPKMDGLMENPY